MRLVALVDDPHGPVARHRVRAFATHLADAGFRELDVQAIPKRLRDRFTAFGALSGADLVVLCRKLFTGVELTLLRRHARRLCYDLDDAVLFRDPFRGRPHSHVRRRRFRRTCRAADLATPGNPYLADLVRGEAPGAAVRLAPTGVDTDRYSPGPRDGARGFRVGWIGTGATRPYLSLVAPALASVAARRPDLVVAVMADAVPAELRGLPVEFTRWSAEAEVPFLRSLDVGLMPLSEDPFSRGKCGFKLLQYMACGVAAVASPVGVNVEICDHGRAGLLASGDAAWSEAIESLSPGGARARDLASAGRARVEERWSVRVLGPPLAAALAGCARGGAE